MLFDKWAVIRDNETITFKRVDMIIVKSNVNKTTEKNEKEFLRQNYVMDIHALELKYQMEKIIEERFNEIELCIRIEASIADIF